MKYFYFNLLATALMASDENAKTAGPTTTTVTSSTVKISPTVINRNLTVEMNVTWTMSAALALDDTMEFFACFQQAVSRWYCNHWVRTI